MGADGQHDIHGSEYPTSMPSLIPPSFSPLQAAIQKLEVVVADHTQYQDTHQTGSDWLTLVRDRLSTCVEVTGDKHTLTNKLDRIQVRLGLFLVLEHKSKCELIYEE